MFDTQALRHRKTPLVHHGKERKHGPRAICTTRRLDAEGQEIYDRIRRDRNAPEVGLQFRALLHSPKATGYLTSTGSAVTFPECYAGEPERVGHYPGGP